MKETTLDETQRHFIDLIHSSSESLSRIVNDILDLSKLEANKVDIEKHRFNLTDLINETTAFFSATLMNKPV